MHDGVVEGAVFSKDEKRILTWSSDNTARLWDTSTGKQIGPSLMHDGYVEGAVFSKDEKRILTWSWDGTARIWDAFTGKQIGPSGSLRLISFTIRPARRPARTGNCRLAKSA
jgi:WD40 repeat protein